MKRIQIGLGFVLLLLGLGLLPACASDLSAPKSGGEPAAAPGVPATTAAPQEEAEAEPTTLADAEALLEKARLNLDRLALNEAPAAAAEEAAPRAPSAPAPSPQLDQSRRADKSASAESATAPPAKPVSTCETACKAFSSLTRASDAVCRLDTDGGKRCERARQIRENASQRVASCGCVK